MTPFWEPSRVRFKNRLSRPSSTSQSASAPLAFCVQQPLQSLFPQVSITTPTIDLPPCLKHTLWRFIGWAPSFPLAAKYIDTTLCDWTQDSDSLPEQYANSPS